jgi:predicted transcriptional regulator
MGSLELAVLEVLWADKEALKPGEVLERLDIKPSVTYSTVMTILRRLWKKGLVERHRVGRAFHYRPLHTREEQVAQTMSDAFDAALDPSVALGHFVNHLSADEVSTLRRLLRSRR